MIITIDGPSGTGKSTVARALAKKLNFSFFDTGALYRSLAWWILQKKIPLEEIDKVLSQFIFSIQEEGENKRYFVDDVEVTNAIRTKEITALSSKIAAIDVVRKALLPIQKEYAKCHNSVFEGRDLGSVVFPEAEIKFFLTADPITRAERRYLEILSKDPSSSIKKAEILEDLGLRDERDSSRLIAPLKCPDGAFTLDTTELTQEQVVDILLQYVLKEQESGRLVKKF